MLQRILGENLQVSAIGYGAMGLSGYYGEVDDKVSIKLLQTAYELGINFFDTADIYTDGHNETLLGNAFSTSGLREQIIIATRGGVTGDTRRPETLKICNEPDYIKKACDASLQRLQTDYIDLYYLNRLDPKIPLADSIGALADLVSCGKVRHIGLCEVTAATLQEANSIHRITALESEYSLWMRELEENDVLNTCKELNIGLVPFSPLGRGFLAGAITADKAYTKSDLRATLPRYQKGNVENNLRLFVQFEQIAATKNITPAQLALAWLLAQGEHIVPIPGTKQLTQLQENIAAVEGELSTTDLDLLNQLFSKENIKGSRYPEGLAKLSDQ